MTAANLGIRRLRSLADDRSGVAMIEFAFALPIMLTIVMAGLETANLAVTTLRVNQMAMLAADNAARVRNSMDERDVEEVMVGLRFAGTGIKFGQYGRVIISALEPNGKAAPNTGLKITWQRCFGAKNATSTYGITGDGANNASLVAGMGPTGKKIRPVDNNALMFAEIRYDYQPITAGIFLSPFELTARQAFTVRDRAVQTLTNTSGMSTTKQRLCDASHLSAT